MTSSPTYLVIAEDIGVPVADHQLCIVHQVAAEDEDAEGNIHHGQHAAAKDCAQHGEAEHDDEHDVEICAGRCEVERVLAGEEADPEGHHASYAESDQNVICRIECGYHPKKRALCQSEDHQCRDAARVLPNLRREAYHAEEQRQRHGEYGPENRFVALDCAGHFRDECEEQADCCGEEQLA